MSPPTIAARSLLLVLGLAAATLLSLGTALGYWMGRLDTADATRATSPSLNRTDGPQSRLLIERLGALTGRLSRVESEARALAARLGIELRAAQPAVSQPSGGPYLPVAGDAPLEQLESSLAQLEATLAHVDAASVEQTLDTMAYPSRVPVAVEVPRFSSGFGQRRDPFTGRRAHHSGVDIAAAYGTPVLASGGGRVRSAGYHAAYGKMVIIDHGDGLASLYGHASALYVRAGDVVMPNQRIAAVGSTGRSSGPHLHFEVLRDGERVEPRRYLATPATGGGDR